MTTDTSGFDASVATELQKAIGDNFNVTPLVLIPILVVIAIVKCC